MLVATTLSKRRKWITLVTASLAMFLLGAIYAYGVLLPAIMADFGWSRSTAALPQAVLLFIYAWGMGLGGILQDRTSPTRIAILGGGLFGLGVLLAGLTHSLFTLLLCYGVLAGIGFGFAYVTAVTSVMKTFPLRRGLVAGIVVGAFGLGTFVWAPLAQHIQTATGWQGVFVGYGLLALVLLPVLGLGIRAPWHPHDVPGEHPEARGLSLAGALRTPVFWVVFVAYTLVTAVGLLLLAHLVNFGIARGLPPSSAALLLSVLAVGSGVGRFVMGWLSDRIGRFPSLLGATFLEIVVLLLLINATAPASLFILASAAGFAFGTWLSLYGPTATDLFGMRHGGAIYGILYLSYGLGGLLGPTLGGYLADLSGSYDMAFIAGIVLCVFAAAGFLIVMLGYTTVYPHPPALEEEYPV